MLFTFIPFTKLDYIEVDINTVNISSIESHESFAIIVMNNGDKFEISKVDLNRLRELMKH